MKRITAIALSLALALTSLSGCYNTYQVPTVEMRKLQSPRALMSDPVLNEQLQEPELQKLVARQAKDPVAVKTKDNKQVAVTPDTKVFVRSAGGRRYRVTPFNFRIAGSQLVASDRDTLLPLATISANEVDLLSTGKTAGLIAVGVGAVAGVIVAIVASSGQKTFSE